MKEENSNSIFRKKWFFPAAYLTIAALLLTGVLWYQNLDSGSPLASDSNDTETSNNEISRADQSQAGSGNVDFDSERDTEPVMEQTESMLMPVADENQAKIVTKFYDYDADSEDQEKALVLYNNKYYQSKGVDIASAEDETFDVTASLSGTVTEVKKDPLLGNVIQMTHDNDLTTYYASLENVLVETGAEVKQGDTIGSAGRNIYGQASGVHVHFEVRKAGVPVNPEDYFNKPMTEIEKPDNSTEESNQSDGSKHDAEGTTSQEDATSQDNAVNSEDDGDDAGDDKKDPKDEGKKEQETESSAAMANT
ncbi:M23 family metallopeptidase [Aquibacillus salsiterrae]|uniref:M23 family metallopeptidase n=1 Tax=Aquibacillus salsiterrae TaxID=2950439 RepID=A0A9X4AFT5_9BACI|nr:M23 family metallopeptidase [Aquibacillus salsiterrae]MDC3418357.1 M23 family metallopeptidase [Aquibacillus salsiterrae]